MFHRMLSMLPWSLRKKEDKIKKKLVYLFRKSVPKGFSGGEGLKRFWERAYLTPFPHCAYCQKLYVMLVYKISGEWLSKCEIWM